MNKSKLAFGIIGTAGIVIFIAAAIFAITAFEHGDYSPLNGFVGELGVYTDGYLSSSTALVFNIGLAISGLLVCSFMVGFGIQKSHPLYTAASFFGILTGILIVALSIYSLNFTKFHYIANIALFASVFVTGVLYVIATIITDRARPASIVSVAVAFIAAGLSAAFVYFMATGGMAQVFKNDAGQIPRASVMPFALIEWLAVALLFVLVGILAVRMINEAAHTRSVSSSVKTGMRGIEF